MRTLGTLVLLTLAYGLAQNPANAMLGRWRLNVSRTHYGGGAEPRTKEIFDCERVKSSTSCTTRSVREGGRAVVGTFTAPDDGTPGSVQGISDVDEVRLVAVDMFIVDATFRQRGKPVLAYRAVRSSDGKSLTIISVDPETRAVLHSVVVYDAVQP